MAAASRVAIFGHTERQTVSMAEHEDCRDLPRHSYLCRSARSYADGYAQYATLPRGT